MPAHIENESELLRIFLRTRLQKFAFSWKCVLPMWNKDSRLVRFSNTFQALFLHINLLYQHCMPNHIISKYTWFILLGGHKTTKLFGIGFYAHDIISRFIEKTDKTIILDLFLNEKIIGSKMITLGLTSLLFVSTFSLVFWSSMIDNTFFFVTEFWRTEVHVKAHTQSTYGNIPAWPQMSQNLFTIISSSSDCLLCP